MTGRRGAVRLLRRLGFVQPPSRADELRRRLPECVNAVFVTRGEVVCAWLIEVRGAVDAAVVRDVARATRAADPIAFHLAIVATSDYARFALACDGPDRAPRHVLLERDALRASDVDVVAEMVPREGEAASAMALRFGRALDRSRVTQRFFRDVAGMRDEVARAWTGIPRQSKQNRDALALLLLSRLLFLYFLQRRGQLADDPEYLPNLLRGSGRAVVAASSATPDSRPPARTSSFYRATLRTLFFGVLNRRPEQRTAAARALGELPYLNGGLFEEHRLELRHARLDLPDVVLARVFTGLLEKYRFTTAESSEAVADSESLGIDPEMLGRIFEGLMPGEERGRTGTFYTPPAIVERVVAGALAEHLAARCAVPVSQMSRVFDEGVEGDVACRETLARELASLRVLDPACGSGAFLMGALVLVARLRGSLGGDAMDVRRDIVARTLHGVDLLEDAALICSLRLWLALIPRERSGSIPPLPNLDRRVRQGDALIDPLDLRLAWSSGHPLDVPPSPELRAVLARLAPAAARYVQAEPEEKAVLRRELNALERQLARSWMASLASRLERLEKELKARAADRDLFGEPLAHALAAARRLAGVAHTRGELQRVAQEMARSRALPFFSFRVHFAEATAGFDLVISNPPWVRAHRWPAAVRRILRERYRVCAEAGWPEAARLSRLPVGAGAQVDLSLLFLERSIELLAAGGTLGMLLPAKLLRSLYAGGARALVRSALQPLAIEDHSLDHRAIFDADSFTAVLIARRRDDGDAVPRTVRVSVTRAGSAPLRFEVAGDDLPLRPGDDRAPWLLAPPPCSAAFRQMQRAPAVGEDAGVSIRRGVMTGCNDVLVLRHVEPKLGDLAAVRADGFGRAGAGARSRGFSALVEASAVRPALRGTDVSAWGFRVQRHIVWVPANDDPAVPPPPRTRRYLERHRTRLCSDVAGHRRARIGTLHRLGAHTLGHKVVWSDVARSLRAAAVPARMRAVTGIDCPVVPLNTVYFVATASHRESLLLAAYFNSTPVRTFARAIAERAKDAHFRFFAWTIAVVPLPAAWRCGRHAEPLLELSRRAHDNGAVTNDEQAALDEIVCAAYELSPDHRGAVRELDAWFNGAGVERA